MFLDPVESAIVNHITNNPGCSHADLERSIKASPYAIRCALSRCILVRELVRSWTGPQINYLFLASTPLAEMIREVQAKGDRSAAA